MSSGGEVISRLWDPHTGKQLLGVEHPLGRFSLDGRWLSASEKAPDLYNARRAVIRFEVAGLRSFRTFAWAGAVQSCAEH